MTTPARALNVWSVGAWTALAAGAATDATTPLGFAHGSLFAVGVLLAAGTGRRTSVLWVTGAAIALTALGYVTSPPSVEGFPQALVVANRIVSMLVLAATAALALRLLGIARSERARRTKVEDLANASSLDTRLMAIASATAIVGGWSVDLPTMRATWSDEVARIHGEPPGTSPAVEEGLDYYHPDDRGAIAAAVEACIRDGTPFDLELRLLAKAEGQKWVRAVGRAVRDGTGRINTMVGAFQDVTLRVDAEEALAAAADRERRHEAELVATLDRISEAFVTLDDAWRITYLNARAERLLARTAADLVGKVAWDEFPGAVGAAFERHAREARASGVSTQFETFFEPLHSWFEVRVHPTDGALAVFFEDVSERRATNARLRLLEAAVEQLDEIVMITEAEPVVPEPYPRVLYVNAAFERVTGYRREEIIGRSPRLLQGPDTDAAEKARIRAALEAWKPVRSTLLNFRKDGTSFWIDLHIVPVADASGWFTHWIAIERDVTEERAQTARWASAQRMESIGQLTGGMAHDFNNLLTVIGGSAEVLHQRLDGHEFERRLAATIVAASDRGAKLTHSMLAFARQQPLDPRPVDAGELLDQMRILVERTLGESVELTFSAPEDERLVTFVDPHQLESALLNLILNARDAMPDGGQLTVEVGRTVLDPAYAEEHDEVAPGSYVVFAVSDTGVGIAPEQLPRVFEPFYTTKAHGAGSGLGLAMVFGFAKQSRGHVAVYSEVGHGTTVRLFVPAHRLAEAAPPRSSQAVADDLRGHETIVVVEDDAMVRAFAAEQLRDLGYDVHEAANGAEALALLAALAQVDLLFTDVVMPGGMNGRQLADEARRRDPQLGVLFASGYTENAIVHHGRLDPGVELLSKPYRRGDLARRVRMLLDDEPGGTA